MIFVNFFLRFGLAAMNAVPGLLLAGSAKGESSARLEPTVGTEFASVVAIGSKTDLDSVCRCFQMF